MKLNIQLFGGRGAKSASSNNSNPMKTLKQLQAMVKKAENPNGTKEGRFLSYNAKTKEFKLRNDYEYAKLDAWEGGQVLVIATNKVYEYKIKTDEEFSNYLRNQVYNEAMKKRDRYGI